MERNNRLKTYHQHSLPRPQLHIYKMAKKEETVVESKSEARIAFEALIEQYKKESPLKYEQKKAELEAKLAKL